MVDLSAPINSHQAKKNNKRKGKKEMGRLLGNNLSKRCYMILGGGWGVAGEKEGKTLVRFKQPTLDLGRTIQTLNSELVPCYWKQQEQGLLQRQAAKKSVICALNCFSTLHAVSFCSVAKYCQSYAW